MKIFFIGIGGISMSGLAMICKDRGYDVYGSDRQDSDMTEKLKNNNIKIYIGHNKDNVTNDINIVVYTAAISKDNEELLQAKNLGIETMERSVFLGNVMQDYDNSIAISGTHGKTTTTSVISTIFDYAKKSPTSLIGGLVSNIGSNVKIGKSDFFITEACEYVDSFLQFLPKIAIITNIEQDHLDYFEDLKQIQNSFFKFAQGVKEDGFIIANGDDKNVLEALENIDKTVYYVGFEDSNDFVIKNVTKDEKKYPSFDIFFKEKFIGNYKLKVYGNYNIYNCVYAIVTAYMCKIDTNVIRDALLSFEGVGRRFEYIGNKNGVEVYDDYAHHPTEIRATLSAGKLIRKKRLISVFQPHTYTRTKSLFNDFSRCFFDSDIVTLADIYAAREPFDETISSKMLCDEINKQGLECNHFDSFDKIKEFLDDFCKEDDIVFTIGAGDVYKIGKMYIED